MRTDAESVYIHGAFLKHCCDQCIKVSPCAPYFQQMNAQAERYFGVVTDMARALLKTSGMDDK